MTVSVIVGEGSNGQRSVSVYESELVRLASAPMPGWARLRYDYAAGYAAAECVKMGCAPREYDGKRVSGFMKKQGYEI